MTINVIVKNVEKTKAGKTDRIVLHYTSDKSNGETWKVGALAVKLDEESRAKLNTVQAGDTVGIDIAKDGNYWNLTKVGDPVQTAYSSRSAGSSTKNAANKTSGYDNLGQQIGNSITNAVNSLGAGHTVAEYKQRAIELIQIGNEIRELINSDSLVSSEAANVADDDELTKEVGF